MDFEIITNVYNGENVIGQFLAGLSNQTVQDFKVFIVDDGSTDGTVDVIKKFSGNLNIKLSSIPHSGQRTARREGVEKSKAPLLIFLDADLILEKNAIKEFLKPFSNKDVGMVTGLLKGRGDNTVAKAYGALRGFFYKFRANKKNFDWAPGGFFAIRRNVLEEVGGYITEKKGSGDLDLSWKVRKGGYKIYFNKDIIAYHWDPDSIKEVWKREKRIGFNEFGLTQNHRKELLKIKRLLRFYPLLLLFIIPLFIVIHWSLLVILFLISYIGILLAVKGSFKCKNTAWLIFNIMNIAYCTGFISAFLKLK